MSSSSGRPTAVPREEDSVGDIIKLEDKTPPKPLVESHQKHVNSTSISDQVYFWFMSEMCARRYTF